MADLTWDVSLCGFLSEWNIKQALLGLALGLLSLLYQLSIEVRVNMDYYWMSSQSRYNAILFGGLWKSQNVC